MNNQNSIKAKVSLSLKALEEVKEAFNGAMYAKISIDVVNNILNITCPLKKKAAARGVHVYLDNEIIIEGEKDRNFFSSNPIIMRLAYPGDVSSCIRIPKDNDCANITFIINDINRGCDASSMIVNDTFAGDFKFEAISPKVSCIWNEVKDEVMIQKTQCSFKTNEDILWSIGTLNKMNRNLDAFVIIASKGKPIVINTYCQLDNTQKEILSGAVENLHIEDINSIPNINSIEFKDYTLKGDNDIINIISPESLNILPFNKGCGEFSMNEYLLYYDIENTRYTIPVKKSL